MSKAASIKTEPKKPEPSSITEKPAVNEKPKPKKPAGAVSMFGGVDLFGASPKSTDKKPEAPPKKKGIRSAGYSMMSS